MNENLIHDELWYVDLDFSDCHTYDDIHDYIREKLELPEWYGANLDALWDSLSGIMYIPADITIHYHPKKGEDRDVVNYMKRVIGIFKGVEKEYDVIIVHLDVDEGIL